MWLTFVALSEMGQTIHHVKMYFVCVDLNFCEVSYSYLPIINLYIFVFMLQHVINIQACGIAENLYSVCVCVCVCVCWLSRGSGKCRAVV